MIKFVYESAVVAPDLKDDELFKLLLEESTKFRFLVFRNCHVIELDEGTLKKKRKAKQYGTKTAGAEVAGTKIIGAETASAKLAGAQTNM
uniref:Uncharacterized protein n=1 Tax=Romanomermis culicivorax TaxID=13658 RepID=A0A915L7V3_ROMCU